MAIIRKNELNEMSVEALQQKLVEITGEIAREKGLIEGTGKPSNPGKYKEMRRLRARIKTELAKRGIKA
ncbi:MAG: 50S ribosomal protein L29 [Candidatus Micrarchaeia archaeon]|jgi:large subunit ribosomal protein L29